MNEEKPACPKCGSAMTFAVGQQRHCNSCGCDHAVDRNPIATKAADRKSQGFRGWKRETQK